MNVPKHNRVLSLGSNRIVSSFGKGYFNKEGIFVTFIRRFLEQRTALDDVQIQVGWDMPVWCSCEGRRSCYTGVVFPSLLSLIIR